MLIEPNRTPYDVHFRIFGIPVRIHPLYWLIAALFAFPPRPLPVLFWPIGIAILFLSLMVHELGHALMFRNYGVRSNIVLYGFGGLAIPDRSLRKRSQRIIVSLAGPFAGFLLLGAVWASNKVEPWALASEYTLYIYLQLFFINLYWGLINLLPVYPLDGGRVSEEVCTYYRPHNGLIIALKISLVVAASYAVYSILVEYRVIPPLAVGDLVLPGGIFAGVLFGLLAYSNYEMLQQVNRHYGGGGYWTDDRTSWER
jgi:stage IV sporulation protein FB